MNKNFISFLVDEYEEYLKTLSKEELELEYSKHFELLQLLEYTYNYIKSYYYCNIYNIAHGAMNTELYICFDKNEIADDLIENFKIITENLKLLSDYIIKFCEDVLTYDRDECIIWDHTKGYNIYYAISNITNECSNEYRKIKTLGDLFKVDYDENINLIKEYEKNLELYHYRNPKDINEQMEHFAWNCYHLYDY